MTEHRRDAEKLDHLSYQPRIVAFIDILGFRAFVSQAHAEAVRTLKAIDEALAHTLKCIREQDDEGWVSVRGFSDCFCLSTEERYLPTLMDAVAFLQYYLVTSGIFIRGGISTGHHCETANMIFSQGLINAYELQKREQYPRVLIGPELVPRILCESYLSEWGGKGPLASYLLVDNDGVYFLDYLEAVVLASQLTGSLHEFLIDHAGAIRRELAKDHRNESILRKHLWVSAYHNFRFDEEFSPEDWDPGYFAQLRDKAKLSADGYQGGHGQLPRFARPKA